MAQSIGRIGLVPLHYFLWGYVKSIVYAKKLATIDELRMNIESETTALTIFFIWDYAI